MKEKEDFDLGADDAAIIFRTDGTEEIILPKKDDDADTVIDSPEWKALVIAVFLANKDMYEEVSQRLQDEINAKGDEEDVLN